MNSLNEALEKAYITRNEEKLREALKAMTADQLREVLSENRKVKTMIEFYLKRKVSK